MERNVQYGPPAIIEHQEFGKTGSSFTKILKGSLGGCPELSLFETTRFAPNNHSFALASSDVKKECGRRQNLGVAPVRLELTTSKVRT